MPILAHMAYKGNLLVDPGQKPNPRHFTYCQDNITECNESLQPLRIEGQDISSRLPFGIVLGKFSQY